VVLVTLGIGNFFWKKYNSEENRYNQILAHSKEVPIIEVINTEEKIKLVTLPDGSSVILKKNARISYPKLFSANEREVAMLGEVFFEVRKETGHPFYIHSGEMMAKVTGTSFSIKANIADDQVSLLVKTGSVEVGIWDGKKNIEEHASRKTLQANQLATLDEKSGALQTSDAAGATLLDLPIESQNFTFKKTPVKEVFKILELAYGIQISFDEQVTSSCNITAHLSDEPVREKLELICEVLNAKFEMKDNAVLILSEGCGH
jgi:transmembrane sensor